MSPDTTPKNTKLCPTCGTRLSEDAVRCLVCGTELTRVEKPAKPTKAVQGSRMPEITFSLPVVLGFILLFIAVGAGSVYFMTQRSQAAVPPATVTPTTTITPTASVTPTPPPPTPTDTPLPTATPIVYKIASGDTCLGIALRFGVSIQSIVLLNELPAACDTLFPGQELKIPQPTATPTPLPTATMSDADATRIACGEVEYTVQTNDTLSSIAANYAVSIGVLKEYNGLVNDTVRSGQKINIPLCQRLATAGPSPTPTLPPPYQAPNLLLPADGTAFVTSGDETITLQWAAVGTLRESEAYAITIVDVTKGTDEKIVNYVTDTKFIVPNEIRPADNTPHIIRWWVIPVRQIGTSKEGNPVWDKAGESSVWRDFVWMVKPGTTGATPTP